MKEQILKLRNEGKTYNEIKNIVGCSKGTISYYCNPTQKEKTKIRRTRRREKNIILKKVEYFKYNNPKSKRYKIESIRKYQKRDNNVKGKINKNLEFTFTWKDVLEKFGENTFCYLSGEKINLYEDNYSFDHIIPSSKNGGNGLSNMGVLHKVVNTMKFNLEVNELLYWCKKILEFNGYKVENIGQ